MNRSGELTPHPEAKKLIPKEEPQSTARTATRIEGNKSEKGRVVYPREPGITNKVKRDVILSMIKSDPEELEGTSIMSRTIFGKDLEDLTPEEIAIFNIDYNFPSTKKMMDVLATQRFEGKTYQSLTPEEKGRLLREFYEHPNNLTNNFLSAALFERPFDASLTEEERARILTRTQKLATLTGLNKVDVARNHISLPISEDPIGTNDDYISAGERFPMGVIEKDDVMSFVLFGVPMAETTSQENEFIKSKVVGNLEKRLGIFQQKEGAIDTENIESLAQQIADARNTYCDLHNLPKIETYPIEELKEEQAETGNIYLELFPNRLKKFINRESSPNQLPQNPKLDQNYLNRHLSPPEWVERLSITNSDQKFFETLLGCVDYQRPEGHDIVGDEEMSAEVAFTSIPEETIKCLKRLHPNIKNLRRFKILTKLEFRGKGGSAIKLDDILPPGTTVYFEPFGYYYKEDDRSQADIINKNVFLTDDPVSIKGLAILLHEVGHIADMHDQQGAENSNMKRLIDSVNSLNIISNPYHKYAATVMWQERNAWAFALKHMRKLFEPDSLIKKGLFNLIHNDSLSAYSKHLQSNQGYK